MTLGHAMLLGSKMDPLLWFMCVVGGLIFAQIVTLYLTPVFYTYMDSLQTWLSRGRRKESDRRTPCLESRAVARAAR